MKIFGFSLQAEVASAAAKSSVGMMLDLEAVKESLPDEAVLSSGAVELMRQMKQQQEANASAGGNLLGNVGSTMAMASIMQLMTSRKPAPAQVVPAVMSAPTTALAPAPVKMTDTAKREPETSETERSHSIILHLLCLPFFSSLHPVFLGCSMLWCKE